MRWSRIGLAAAVAALFTALGGAAWAQAPDAAAVERGEALFGKLGCAGCHGAPGAGRGRGATDLVNSPLARMQDGGKALYLFMNDMAKGHPDLNGRPAAGIPAVATVSQAQAADLLAKLSVEDARLRVQKGRAEAPAVIAAAGAPCKMTDAAYVAISNKAKTQTDAYELACDGAIGRVVVRTITGKETRYEVRDCITASSPTADGKPNPLTCVLPANRDPLAQLAPYLADAGLICDLKQARALGFTADGVYFEAACAGDRGYVVSLPPTLDPAGKTTGRNCLAIEPGAPTACRLTSRAAMLASVTAPLLAGAGGGACQVKDRRYVASSRGDEYYEISCLSGPGFMVAADFRGGFKARIDCANADDIAGGCTLTDLKTAQTADNARYAGLARAAGYDCDVSGYRVVASTAQDETVEMACANRPDGAMALFPKVGGGAGRVFNCAAAETTGYRCGLTGAEAAFAQLTAAVRKTRPTSTCQVSASRFMGVTPDGGFVEVACADREPGYVLQYAKATAAPTAALYCSQLSAQLGVACALPTNVGK